MFGVFLFRNITRISLLYSEYHICERKGNLESPEKEECIPLFPATDLSTMPLGTNKEGTSMHYESQMANYRLKTQMVRYNIFLFKSFR